MTLPKRPPSWMVLHRTRLEVRVTDLNYGNHLGNDALLGYLQQGRVKLLHGLGWGEQDVGGVGLIMRGCQIDFCAESFLFDDLELEVGLSMSGRARCRFDYRLTRTNDQVEVANAITHMAFFDYIGRRVSRAPRLFQERISGLNQTG